MAGGEAHEPTEAEIVTVAGSLHYFEDWCARNNVALSALGRTAIQDQAVLYRWRNLGLKGASAAKREALATYILKHPSGIPGYTRSKTGRKIARSGAFVPNGPTPVSSRTGTMQDAGPSTKLPVPALSLLEMDDLEYVKAKAFNRHCPIAVILAEMVALGIRCDRENEFEEQTNALQQNPKTVQRRRL